MRLGRCSGEYCPPFGRLWTPLDKAPRGVGQHLRSIGRKSAWGEEPSKGESQSSHEEAPGSHVLMGPGGFAVAGVRQAGRPIPNVPHATGAQ